MNVGSTFSSVGGLDLGLERAGMRVVWQAEVDEWRRRVLRWHWPDARIYDDVRSVALPHAGDGVVYRTDGSAEREPGERRGIERSEDPARIDLLCGGFPCQDLSVAGKRAGLAGERSGLFFEFARIADEFRPAWLLVENVVGLLSSANGRDFGVVLATLADLGYGLAWRVVDARYFGVPQRRRRVFVVGRLGDDGRSALLALGAGGEGDLAAGKCSWQESPTRAGEGADGTRFFGDSGMSKWSERDQAVTLARRDYKSANTLAVNTYGEQIAKPLASLTGGQRTTDIEAATWAESPAGGVRRLTPVECERLMSWPDGWTAVDGDATPDTRRYAACGDGVVSNVAEWIGRRIMAVERSA